MGACTSNKSRRFEVVRNFVPYKQMPFQFKNRIHVTAIIWPKNQHNLFDFESNQYTVKEIEVDFTSQLVCVDKQLLALTKSECARNQVEIADLILDEHTSYLQQVSSLADHKIWAILRSETTQFQSIDHWDLRLNDIIKLGRVRMQLTEFAFMKPADEMTQYQDDEHDETYTLQELAACRICFSGRATEANPLISPCNCEGSVKYVHLECLQKWIGVQLKIRQGDHFIQYLWKKLECEICKYAFKSSYSFGDKQYPVIKIPKPKSSYLTFKVTNDDKAKEAMIYVVEVGEKTELKIGRVPDCDIKLRDISVSRQHAILRLLSKHQEGSENLDYTIRLQDHKSKFGTLVLAQNQDLLTIQQDGQTPILYQTGRVLLQCVSKKKTNTNKVVYKHPDNISLFKVEEKQTLGVDLQEHQSYDTNDMLNQSEIIISNGHPVPQAPLPHPVQPLQSGQIAQPHPDLDESVCDER